MKINSLFLCLTLAFLGCSENVDTPVDDNLSKLDKMYINGFSMKLEQVYVMNGENSIPYLDIPKDSAFKSGRSSIDIYDYVSYNENRDTILQFISKNEVWNIHKMRSKCDTIYIEHGYGENYFVTTVIVQESYNEITCVNEKIKRHLAIKVKIGSPYVQRGHDNHFFNILVLDDVDNNVYKSNLYFEVLTNNGNGLFSNGKNIYLDTNGIYTVSRQITPPLTGDKVKEEISKGNYKLYIYNNMTTYQIGNNLYIPRYGSYIYVGSINTNGMVLNLDSKYYRFKFRII